MTAKKKTSPFIRITSGVLCVLGFSAIAFNAAQDGGIQLSFMLFASFLAGFVFLFVAFFGKYPWHVLGADEEYE